MTRARHVLACFTLLTLLSACGSATPGAPASTSAPAVAEAPATAAPTASAQAAPEATAAPTASAAAGAEAGAASCGEGFRLFDHELLATEPICIPSNPTRVVALDMAALETLLLLDKTPAATASWILQEMPLLLPQFADELADLEGLGYPAELEKLTLLKPDLILAAEDTVDIKLASAIAPVVAPNPIIYDDWKLGVQFWADVLNVPGLYTDMEANYRTRVAELQKALGQPDALKVSVISSSTYGISMWMPDSAPGAVLQDVGLLRPEGQSLVGDASVAKYGERQYIPISLERLDLADGDAIFYFTYAATDPKVAADESAYLKSFEQQPVWQALGAVKAKRAFFVGGHWWRSQTYLLANMVVDDLFTHLTDTKATTSVLSLP